MVTGRPNVIVFFTDQQRWDTSSLHGNPLDLMPNFDRMASSGTHLSNHFTCQPVCGPARACLQTGRYATQNGTFRNRIPLDPNAQTLAKLFREAGYRTGYIGKWHLGGTTPSWDIDHQEPVPPDLRGGYEDWLAADMLEFASTPYDTRLFDTENREVRLPGYRVDALTDAAIRYVDRRVRNHPAEPFFLFLSFLEPHQQNYRDDYPAPKGYEARYRGAWVPPDLAHFDGSAAGHLPGYYGMVRRLDEAFGRMLDALYSLGIQENTIVLFTSDHGNHFKTRNSEYKRSCHEASIRVPAAICGPGFDSGGRVTALTSLIDLPPTLLDAAGITPPQEMAGRSVLPLVRNPKSPWPDEVFIQISESQVGRAVRTRRWKYSVTAPEADPLEDSSSPAYVEEYLYDLESDPYELVNLAGIPAYRAVSQRMQERLIARIREVEGYEPDIRPAPEVPGGGQRVVRPEESEE